MSHVYDELFKELLVGVGQDPKKTTLGKVLEPLVVEPIKAAHQSLLDASTYLTEYAGNLGFRNPTVEHAKKDIEHAIHDLPKPSETTVAILAQPGAIAKGKNWRGDGARVSHP